MRYCSGLPVDTTSSIHRASSLLPPSKLGSSAIHETVQMPYLMSKFGHTIDGITTPPIDISNDVEIAPPTGISVLIVGAGVGGLVAALECTRKGHSVRIFEREAAVHSTGMQNIQRICEAKA